MTKAYIHTVALTNFTWSKLESKHAPQLVFPQQVSFCATLWFNSHFCWYKQKTGKDLSSVCSTKEWKINITTEKKEKYESCFLYTELFIHGFTWHCLGVCK